MSTWCCETCVYYPPSSCDGKPCCACEPDDPLMSCYEEKEDGSCAKEVIHTKDI